MRKSSHTLRLSLFAAPLVFLFAARILSAQAAGVIGDWQDPTQSIIHIDRCGTDICLWLVALGPAAPSLVDIHNPEPPQRNRALCGLQIGSGFALLDTNHAAGGMLYDPKTGKTYRGKMTAEGAKLNLRGYVGIPLFGASETWTRHTGTVGPCKTAH